MKETLTQIKEKRMLFRSNRLLPSFPILLSPAKGKCGLTAPPAPNQCSRPPAPAGGSASSQAVARGQPASAHSQQRREGLLWQLGGHLNPSSC